VAQYFNLDATLIRILFVVLAVLGAPAPAALCGDVDHRPQRAVSRGVIQPGMVHPIPVALTEPHDLGERWLARRSTVDL
jgi:hypothetical protein